MNKAFIVIMILLVMLTGCKVKNVKEEIDTSREGVEAENYNENQVKQLNDEISTLKTELNEKEITIENMNFEKENLRRISDLCLEFSRARDNGDIDKLTSLVSDNIEIIKKDDGIYGKYMVDSYEVEYPLHLYNKDTSYKDMLITGYEYDKEKKIYYVFVQEFFKNDDKQIAGMGFVDLEFVQVNGKWKIDEFSYDI